MKREGIERETDRWHRRDAFSQKPSTGRGELSGLLLKRKKG